MTALDGVFTDSCGKSYNLTFTPASTEGVTYVQNRNGDTLTVTAMAQEGYALTNPEWTQSKTDELKACPVIKPCEETSTSIVSKYEDFADYNDTRATGHTEFTKDGLRIWTEGATSTDKVAWYNIVTPYALSDLGTPAIDYSDSTATTNDEPGMQLLLDFDGNGSTDGTLVGEKVYGANWWLTGGSQAFVKASAPHNGGGNGSQWYGTLNEWLTAFPEAKVTVVGFSLGSGVKGDGILKSLTFGCQTWVFKKAPRVPTQCTVSNNMFDRVWSYDGSNYPEAGAYPSGTPGSFDFQDEGLYINTPARESYVTGFMNGGNTPLADVDAMSYKVLRQTKSGGFEATLPAYVLYVDTNGLDVAGGEKYFFYEPYYNDQTRASVEGTFQTWDALQGGTAKWYMSGTQQKLENWSTFVSQYPDAVVVAHGFNQGTYNAETYSVVQDIVFDCATTKFRYFQGMGGVETPSLPTTPVVSTPVQGQGSTGALPAELPMTGTGGTLTTWFALLAAVLTYGAVYLLQPKKRVEE